MPVFTQDWFKPYHAIDNFEKHLLKHKGNLVHFLEIGTFEGRSAIWCLENVLTHKDSTITCVDSWEGSKEYEEGFMNISDMNEVFIRFRDNVSPYIDKVHIKTEYSQYFRTSSSFDFIYIDASHYAKDALMDGLRFWGNVKKGGIMAFDDYGWTYFSQKEDNKKNRLKEPKIGIDFFLELMEGQYELLEKNWQLWLRKI